MEFANKKLIIIRGPSGTGKSTVSKAVVGCIRSLINNPCCAIIDQDYFLNTIPGNQAFCKELCADMILQCAIACRNKGYDVVLEGILNVVYYSDLFRNLMDVFGVENVTFYYLDISLEESQQRHLLRDKAKDFTADRMVNWYKSASPTNYTNEIIINSSTSSVLESTQVIMDNYLRSK